MHTSLVGGESMLSFLDGRFMNPKKAFEKESITEKFHHYLLTAPTLPPSNKKKRLTSLLSFALLLLII
jgi:hypothetical protein